MSSNQCLVEANARVLREGADLLSKIHISHYSKSASPAFESTIGAHFRHVFEHYRCFFGQLNSGVICYERRERDQILERDIHYAQRTAAELITAFDALDSSRFSRPIQLHDLVSGCKVDTNLGRELLFLQSHTVHHYALIGAISRTLGERPDVDFGVAEATREHQKSGLPAPLLRGKSSCAQ
ncbi:DinB family protein [Arenicella xantha]|uniref:DinB family protein n=1 Tax=Arenicella xantha TaxID=644221 RepID=UPI0011BDB953|nr:hypothetical protein [Arenicella xantha]